jgi:DNA repair protein SbcD/Mre11
VRLLHTADWHLGQTLHGVQREYEHARFLDWLLTVMHDERVDALVVAGDVFDSGNPAPSSLRAFYEFLSTARRRCPSLDVVVVGGNHDSPARLSAPARLLSDIGVRVVGDVPRRTDGSLDPGEFLVRLSDASGRVAAHLAAVPFLRPSDLPRGLGLVDGFRVVYADVLDAARRDLPTGAALVATGHCYMVGGEVSTLSERRIQLGNQEALPVDVFAQDVAYVALGHLHRAQRVGGRDEVRYSGSPIPLSMAERDYKHEVRIVDVDGAGPATSTGLRVPRFVEILTIPETHAPLPEVVAMLEALERRPSGALDPERPLLEVRVLLDTVQPNLRATIETALDGAWPRLVRIDMRYSGTGETLADAVEREHLRELNPEDVFVRCYQRDYEGDVPTDVMHAFRELLDEAYRAG